MTVFVLFWFSLQPMLVSEAKALADQGDYTVAYQYLKSIKATDEELFPFMEAYRLASERDYRGAVAAGLTSITIPERVTSIGSSAFDGCTGLTSITIPASVTSIGSSAFEGCTGLTSITIPEGIRSVEIFAFSGCTALTSITLPSRATLPNLHPQNNYCTL